MFTLQGYMTCSDFSNSVTFAKIRGHSPGSATATALWEPVLLCRPLNIARRMKLLPQHRQLFRNTVG